MQNPNTILDILRRWANETPSRVALIEPDRTPATFAQLLDDLGQLHLAMNLSGIEPLDRVAVWLDSPAAMAVACIATIGFAVCVPVPTELTEKETERFLHRMGIRWVLTDAADQATLGRVTRGSPFHLIPLGVSSQGRSGQVAWRSPPTRPGGIAGGWPAGSVDTGPPLEATALLLQTTGSSAEPKTVPITQQALVLCAQGSARSLELRPQDRCLNFMAFHHIHGLVSGILLPLLSGASCVLPGRFSAADFRRWLLEYRPTWFSAPPAVYQTILKDRLLAGVAGQHALRFVRSGSAAMPVQLAEQIEEALGTPLIEAYGMTEALQITGNPISGRRLGSVGRSIAPELAILDERSRICGAYAAGTVAVRGPTVMSGYLNNPQANQAAFRQGWFLTGDLGWMDEDGFLYLVGRAGDQINRGGEKIAPAEIEEVLGAHPAVREAVVLGVPHPVLGEEPVAAVVLAPEAMTTEAELRTWIRASLSAHKTPRRIVFVEQLPKSSTGKVLKRELGRRLAGAAASFDHTGGVPVNEAQRLVARAFQRILKVDGLEIGDDFFALGATSLDAADLLADLGRHLGESLLPFEFLQRSTIAGFAAHLAERYPEALRCRHLSADSGAPDLSTAHEDTRTRELALPDLPLLTRFDSRRARAGPLFILSASRSGSTLLRVLLAGHSALFAPPEMRLLLYPTLLEWRKALAGEVAFYAEGLQAAVMSAFGFAAPEAELWLATRVRQKTPILRVYEELSRAVKPRIVVDKVPYYALFPEVLRRMEAGFTSPRYLFLTRHPQTMIRSFVSARMDRLWGFGGAWEPGRLAEAVWHRSSHNILAFLEGISEERKCRVSFEDLAMFPERECRRLCEFLHVPYEAEMADLALRKAARMVDPVRSGSRMIGDPHFVSTRIHAEKAELSVAARRRPVLSTTRVLAERLGYRFDEADREARLPELAGQRKLMDAWPGQRLVPGGLIVGRNVDGRRPPLFWCMQSLAELEILAERIGPNQPVWGMRSAHLIGKEERILKGLAAEYVQEMSTQAPLGPLILGGNCQGAHLAWHMARQLEEVGRPPSLLFLMEVDIPKPYARRVALIYGKSSHRNPLLQGRETALGRFALRYPHFTVNEITGAHGQFFTTANIDELVAAIVSRMEAHVANNAEGTR